jgi:AcrR family transcriptional regulator
MPVAKQPSVSQTQSPSRPYDNTLRRTRAAETRDRIINAGCELLHQTSITDWRGLTIRAVADRAGVNESTVFRHFGSERGLKDAVMHHLERQAGINLDELSLDDIADTATKILETVASYPIDRREPTDPTLVETGRRQHEALIRAVAQHTAEWTTSDTEIAAAILDSLWSAEVYQRLAVDWQMEKDRATKGIAWVIGLVAAAIQDGQRPEDPS